MGMKKVQTYSDLNCPNHGENVTENKKQHRIIRADDGKKKFGGNFYRCSNNGCHFYANAKMTEVSMTGYNWDSMTQMWEPCLSGKEA